MCKIGLFKELARPSQFRKIVAILAPISDRYQAGVTGLLRGRGLGGLIKPVHVRVNLSRTNFFKNLIEKYTIKIV